MRSLLITGAAGFIGANFVRYWTARYPSAAIVVLDKLTYAGNRDNLAELIKAGTIEFVHGSILDGELTGRLLREHAIDTIVNFAAESHVDRSITGPADFIDTNVVGTYALLQAAREAWLDEPGPAEHLFHHVSTDEVYGSLAPDGPAFTETTPYAPNSPYAASKAASDHLVRAYHHTYGLQVTTSNCSNNYGPYHYPEKLIPLCLLNILNGKPLPVYGDGSQVRDWLYVEDHCRGIELVINQGRRGQTYNIGGDNERTNIDVVRRLCAMLNRRFADNPELGRRFPDSPCARGVEAETLINFVPDRPGHDTRYAVDAARIRNELGYRPRENFDTGLEKTVDWFLDNEAWWRPVLDKTSRQ